MGIRIVAAIGQANKLTSPVVSKAASTIVPKTLSKTAQDANVLHVLELLPDPYPQYPILITRIIEFHEARKIDALYRVSEMPATGSDSEGHPLNYERLAWNICAKGENSLNLQEEAFVQFVNTLYFFCYENNHYGEKFSLTYKTRRASGSVVINPNKRVAPITALDDSLVDQVLEWALQKRDFQAIRAILNFEGYGVPLTEPNDLVIPAAWDAKRQDKEEVIIKVTPEEYEMWQEIQESPPEEITDPAPFRNTPEYKDFVETMAQNIPLRLEQAIRQRDILALRMRLRLYGRHNIASSDPDNALSGSGKTQKPSGRLPTFDL